MQHADHGHSRRGNLGDSFVPNCAPYGFNFIRHIATTSTV